MMAGVCIGIDVGGTFTDCVVTEGFSVVRAKAPSTHGRIGDGVIAAARLAAARAGETLETLLPRVSRFGLGTTAVTNVLASRTGCRVGLITTAGFEEMLPFARGTRIVNDDGWLVTPPGFVERADIVGIPQRIDRTGTVITPLNDDDVLAAGHTLATEHGVKAIAVSYLWSFLEPAHEQRSVALLRERHPDVTVVSAAELHPAPREYERTTFAVLNAYVSGAIDGIEELAETLHSLGLTVPTLLVHSGGGSITIAEARRRPLSLAVSGPAAGVSASVAVADAACIANVLTCDMGGTSFDVSVVRDGTPARRTRGEVAGVWTALPVIDVESIGAGGGSLGWKDARGVLRVGPRSAGAVPGPACYGRGGVQATVTDALVVLGFIAPDQFLGGEFTLDPDAARVACASLGAELGLDADDTAWGIRTLALADMAKAARTRISSMGLDPREYAILSFGGSGALFTAEIARAIGVPRVLIPDLASVLSAFGAATTDVRRERLRSIDSAMPIDPRRAAQVMAELGAGVREDLSADGVAEADQSVVFEADLRFSRQIFEIQIPLDGDSYDEATNDALLKQFQEEYARRYGRGSIVLGAPAEIVSLRAVGIGRTVHADMAVLASDDVAAKPTPSGTRAVRLARGDGGMRQIPCYQRAALANGTLIDGAALVYGSDTTIWIPDHATARVDGFGNLLIAVDETSAQSAEGTKSS